MLTASAIAAHLTSLLGPDHVREDANTITASPADTQQISALLRYANQHHLTVSPIGGGTKQSWGNPSVPTNILLDTTRLNRVLEHPWQDLTCTVQAGCTWSDLQQTLAQHNQFVALDPLWPDRATVGGIVATNDSGALRHRYGSLRDLIIGMTVVLADGTIAKSGGKVVKNVAGYDLHKLMTGAFGTLGIIAEVTFRLHPLPLHAQTFTVAALQAAQLAPLIAAIRDSHLLTQALQLRGNSHGFHLDIQLNAHPDANQPNQLASLASAANLTLSTIPHDAGSTTGGSSGLQSAEFNPTQSAGFSPGPTTNIWQASQQLFANENAFVIKATMLPANVAQFGERILDVSGSFAAQSLGIMIAAFDAPAHTTAYTVDILRDELEKLGGSLNILTYPVPSWSNLKANRIDPNALPLMQSIKHQFDPNHILNPGHFLGGI